MADRGGQSHGDVPLPRDNWTMRKSLALRPVLSLGQLVGWLNASLSYSHAAKQKSILLPVSLSIICWIIVHWLIIDTFRCDRKVVTFDVYEGGGGALYPRFRVFYKFQFYPLLSIFSTCLRFMSSVHTASHICMIGRGWAVAWGLGKSQKGLLISDEIY